jgi:hypothetical protein
MNFLIFALWAMAAIPVIGLVLWFVGSALFAVDEVKAVRYLAGKYDQAQRG